MFKLSAIAFASLLLIQLPAACAAPSHNATAISAADLALAARIDAGLAASFPADGPGATVLVVRNGTILLRKGYGLANLATRKPMDAGMSMRIGSITKQFTAVSILMLVEQGKLKLSDDITTYLPDFPTHGKHITIEHLLTHTSGIVSYTNKPGFEATADKDMTPAEVINTFKNDPLEFEPGTRFAYDNSGYFLLGAIIEKVSGQPYADFVEQHIFIPLQMTQTAYDGHERSRAKRASGYSRKDDKFVPARALSMTQPYAAGALVSTVDDLARWDAAVAGGKLIGKASLAKASAPFHLADGSSTGYGYGWFIGALQGRPTISHGGLIPGFSTFEVRLPSDGVYVAVLGNADERPGASTETAALRAAALAIGKPLPEPLAVKPDAKVLDAFVGVYRIDAANDHVVRRDGDDLTIQGTGRGRALLRPYAADAFYLGDSNITVAFSRGANGEVDKVAITDRGQTLMHPRTANAAPRRDAITLPVALLDGYVGSYPLAPGFTVVIRRDGARLFGVATGQPEVELFATEPGVFFIKEVDAHLRFSTSAAGATELTLMQGPHTLTAPRIQ